MSLQRMALRATTDVVLSERLFKRIMSGAEFVRGQREFIGAQLPS